MGYPKINCILWYKQIKMNVLELTKDNLGDYMSTENLIVVFASKTCGSCTKLKPHLYNLDPKYLVCILEAGNVVRSDKFIPGGIKFYPTIGYFNNGYFIKELSQSDIINKTIE